MHLSNALRNCYWIVDVMAVIGLIIRWPVLRVSRLKNTIRKLIKKEKYEKYDLNIN